MFVINPLIFKFFDGEYFEQLVMEIYKYLGYNVSTTPKIGDHGVDLILIRGNEKIAVQCKRFKNSVGNKAVQEAFSGMHYYKCNKAIVVTTSKFTRGAIQLAQTLNVELVDAYGLSKIFQSNNNYLGNYFYKYPKLTQILINAGHDLIYNNYYEDAIELLNNIIKHKNNLLINNKRDLINAYNYLALSYKYLGDLTKSEEVFKEGLSIEKSPYLMNNLAELYIDLFKYEMALELSKNINLNDLISNNKDIIVARNEYLNKVIDFKNRYLAKKISKFEYDNQIKELETNRRKLILIHQIILQN